MHLDGPWRWQPSWLILPCDHGFAPKDAGYKYLSLVVGLGSESGRLDEGCVRGVSAGIAFAVAGSLAREAPVPFCGLRHSCCCHLKHSCCHYAAGIRHGVASYAVTMKTSKNLFSSVRYRAPVPMVIPRK